MFLWNFCHLFTVSFYGETQVSMTVSNFFFSKNHFPGGGFIFKWGHPMQGISFDGEEAASHATPPPGLWETLSQVIEYNKINIFFQKSCRKCGRRLVPDLFLIFEKALYELKASGLKLDFHTSQ